MNLRRLKRHEFLETSLGNPNVMVVIHLGSSIAKVVGSFAVNIKVCPKGAAKQAMPPKDQLRFLDESRTMRGGNVSELIFAVNVAVVIIMIARHDKNLRTKEPLGDPRQTALPLGVAFIAQVASQDATGTAHPSIWRCI